jgi:hypothetical protein
MCSDSIEREPRSLASEFAKKMTRRALSLYPSYTIPSYPWMRIDLEPLRMILLPSSTR